MSLPRSDDVFDEVVNLEEQYYQEGYELGVADGSKSGRVEGRTFGLEKGFEKFLEMGKLHGKALIWEARLRHTGSQKTLEDAFDTEAQLPGLGGSERIRKHVERLASLTDPHDLSTENNEDAVSEFDDRLKDSKAKSMLIAKIIGESLDASATMTASGEKSRDKVLRIRLDGNASGTTQSREMEDFGGLSTK